MCERLRDGTIRVYHNFRDEEVHRVSILSQDTLVVFLDTTYLLYSLRDRQVIFAKGSTDWNFQDVRTATVSNDELAVHMRLRKKIIMLHPRTGEHRVLIDKCDDWAYKLLCFPLKK